MYGVVTIENIHFGEITSAALYDNRLAHTLRTSHHASLKYHIFFRMVMIFTLRLTLHANFTPVWEHKSRNTHAD